jgi:hypothetical protein
MDTGNHQWPLRHFAWLNCGSITMVKGHLSQQRSNIHSMQPKPNLAATDTNFAPTSDSPNTQSYYIYAATLDLTGQIATDLTGRFPVTSSQGNTYILVLYNYNSNAILMAPMIKFLRFRTPTHLQSLSPVPRGPWFQTTATKAG